MLRAIYDAAIRVYNGVSWVIYHDFSNVNKSVEMRLAAFGWTLQDLIVADNNCE